MLVILRILAGLVALAILLQAAWMGFYLYGQDGMLALHQIGAMATGVLIIALAIAAWIAVVRKQAGRPLAIAATVTIVALVGEMFSGFTHYTPLHVPLGLLMFGGAFRMVIWVTERRPQ